MLARSSQLHFGRRDNRDVSIEVLKFLCPYSRERADLTTFVSSIRRSIAQVLPETWHAGPTFIKIRDYGRGNRTERLWLNMITGVNSAFTLTTRAAACRLRNLLTSYFGRLDAMIRLANATGFSKAL